MGYGARDRTSGGLAWGTSDAVQWAASVYGGRAGFGLSRISAGGAESDAGYVFIDGADVPVVSAEEEVRRRRDGSPSGFTLSLRDASGAVHLVEGEVVRSEMLPFPGRGDAALVEAVAETRWNGRRGFGIAEFAVRR